MGERIKINSAQFFNIVNLQDRRFQPGRNDKKLFIDNIEIDEEVLINKSDSNISNISFEFGENCLFKNDFTVKNVNFNNLTFNTGCTFEGQLLLENLNVIDSINIFQTILLKDVKLLNIKANSISIMNTEFKFHNLEIQNFKIQTKFVLQNISSNKIVNIFNNLNDTPINIYNNDPKNIINTLVLLNPNNLNIETTEKYIETLSIQDHLSKDFSIKISTPSLKQLIFVTFKNFGEININFLKNLEHLRFKKSEVGNLKFFNSNLSETAIEFESSTLNEITLISTDSPSPNNITTSNINETKHIIDALQNFKKVFERKGDSLNALKFQERELLLKLEIQKEGELKKDIHSQLKKTFEQIGDSVNSQRHQAKELEIHMNSPKISWSERLNLQFAYWSNNFGTDWIKAVKFLIIGATYFYFLVILSQNCEFKNSWNTVLDLFSGFFEFLNPIRKLNSLTINGNEEILNNKARIADFFARIFIAFAEYQLIQAFRKYGKK